jgi:putative endonuclease
MAYVYLLASGRNGTLYIGVTRDLIKRVYEHKSTFVPGFTSRYQINQLVWFQQSDVIESAIVREKHMKACAACVENRTHQAQQGLLARSL